MGNVFDDMFGKMVIPETEKTKDVSCVQESCEPSESDSVVPCDGHADSAECSPSEGEVVSDSADDSSVDSTKDYPKSSESGAAKPSGFPKKDLGMGGASFCDLLIKTAPEWIMEKVRSGEKTMAGCWNWVYSRMRNEYIKANGRVSGGIGGDVSALIETYFREIPEGTVEQEVNVPASRAEAVKKVSEVATKAAKAAKAAKSAKSAKSAKTSKAAKSEKSEKQEKEVVEAPTVSKEEETAAKECVSSIMSEMSSFDFTGL